MLDFNVKNLCYGCGACENICGKNAITMVEADDGFLYPNIDKNKCVQCGICDKACQILNKEKVKDNTITLEERKCFAIYNKDSNIREKSSSGGLFTSLAGKIISEEGLVFGVVFNENMEVVHKAATNLEEVSPMKGSKYVQSKIGTTYKEVQFALKNGKKVLFTGTPCQINGLYKFLKKDYEKLYTVDVVCHGVPSPLIFKRYIRDIEQNGDKVNTYDFRNKETGWKSYSIKVKFENNYEKKTLFNEDIYMKGFLSDLYLRNSCYRCECKINNALSDITIGDFWGIEKKYPQYNDNKGICAVIINSKKGEVLLNKVKEELFIKEVNLKDIVEENPALVKEAKYNKKREAFFKDLNKIDLNKNIEKKIKISLPTKVKRKIGRILREVGLRK